MDRRNFVKAVSVGALVPGIAGCIGDDDDGNGSDREYPDFDSLDPAFPQLASTLAEHGFDVGMRTEFEAMERRDEPAYGNPVQSDPGSGYLDPDTLIYSHAPAEDPAGYEDSVAPLMENIEAETGKDTDFFSTESHAAQVETMRAERLHIAHLSPGTLPFAVNMAGANPLGMPLSGETFGYRLWLVTQADNDEIDELADLAGKSVAHVDAASNSGHLAPEALFIDEGIVPGEDYDYTFTGAHDTSLLGVAHGDYDAAPIASIIATRMDDLDLSELKVVWASQPFPIGAVSVRYDLHPDIIAGIERAMYDYDYTGTAYEDDLGHREFVEVDYATHYHINLVIHRENNIEYDTEGLED